MNWLEGQNHPNECQFEGQWNPCVEAGVDFGLEQGNDLWVVKGSLGSHPVVHVTWWGARSFCEWKGKRLPTEAEWEKASRSNDGRLFPWGNSEKTCAHAVGNVIPGCGIISTAESVGSKSTLGDSPFGVNDLCGNVSEWIHDWHLDDYYSLSPEQNPIGPDSGTARVVRGGGFMSNGHYYYYSVARSKSLPHGTKKDRGFRCAASQWP